MALSKVESASLLVGAGKGFRDTTGIDLGPGWLEVMLTTAPFPAGAWKSGNSVDDKQGGLAIGVAAAYGAAKAGFFMGLGYTAGYVAGQFVSK